MPALATQFDQIQPCDGRDLIQQLTVLVLTRVSELRTKLCTQAETIFAEFGFENFNPCTDLDDEFFKKLEEVNAVVALEYILAKKGFPPHILKYFKEGTDGLTDSEFQDVIEWTSPLVGVNFPANTGAYIRDKNRPKVLLPQQATEVEDALIQQGVTQVQTLIQEAIQTFVAEKIKCPTEEVTRKLLTVVSNIVIFLNAFTKVFENFKQAINIASALISAIRTSIEGLKAATIANDVAIAAATSTGVGVAVTGPIVNASRILDKLISKLEPRIQELDDRLCSAAKTVTYVDTTLDVMYALIQAVEQLLLTCLPELEPEIYSRLTPRSFTASEGISYRGFTLQVRVANSSSPVASQRYGVALDRQGIVVLQGTPSFSADTQILLDEIKFRIDNQLG